MSVFGVVLAQQRCAEQGAEARSTPLFICWSLHKRRAVAQAQSLHCMGKGSGDTTSPKQPSGQEEEKGWAGRQSAGTGCCHQVGSRHCMHHCQDQTRETKRKDYTFWGGFNEKPGKNRAAQTDEMYRELSLPLGGACDQIHWLAEACKVLLRQQLSVQDGVLTHPLRFRGKAPAQMDGLIASLEAKYSKSTARKGRGKREPSVAPEEPSEEQFAAARYLTLPWSCDRVNNEHPDTLACAFYHGPTTDHYSAAVHSVAVSDGRMHGRQSTVRICDTPEVCFYIGMYRIMPMYASAAFVINLWHAINKPHQSEWCCRARLENDHAAANGDAATSQPSPKKSKRKR